MRALGTQLSVASVNGRAPAPQARARVRSLPRESFMRTAEVGFARTVERRVTHHAQVVERERSAQGSFSKGSAIGARVPQ